MKSLFPFAAALALAALVALPAPGLAQVPGQGPSKLAGTVCGADAYILYSHPEASCYSGIPNATLRLQRDGQVGPVGAVDRSATSDDVGRYQFSGLEDGTYTLTVSRIGFDTLTTKVDVKGETSYSPVLTPRTVVTTGRVTGPDGSAIAGANVRACCPGGEGDGVATTAADGSFSMKTKAGRATVSFEAPGFVAYHAEVFLDGQATVDAQLKRVPPQSAAVQGNVRDQAGNPVAGLRIDVYGSGCCMYPGEATPAKQDGGSGSSGSPGTATASPSYIRPGYGGSNSTKTDAQGRYLVHVDPGYVSLSVNDPAYASHNAGFEVRDGERITHDFTLNKYPERTARIQGTVVNAATGQALTTYSLSVSSPLYGRYECSDGGMGRPEPMPVAQDQAQTEPAMQSYPAPPEYQGCAIKVAADGSFSGLVTPGYTILNAYVPQDCHTTQDADGARTVCGQEYLNHVQTLELPANQSTTLTVSVQPRPGPDATLRGFLVDAKSGEAITKGTISLSNLEAYGYGWAEMDDFGSYKLRLRSGYHQVSAYAEGHLHWEGIVYIRAGDNDLDVTLTPGEEAGGSCCYRVMDAKGPSPAMGAPTAAESQNPPGAPQDGNAQGSGTAATYEDLHGAGLGAYDPSRRQGANGQASPETRGSPLAPMGLATLAIVAAAWLSRRKA